MKVSELILWLQGENQDADVHLAYNYGDRNRTTVCPRVSRVEETQIRDSDYFRMPTVVEDDGEGDEPETKPGDWMAVVLYAPGS